MQTILDQKVCVKRNEKLNAHYYRLVFESDFFAGTVKPGQFLNLKFRHDACFLRRPFSVYDIQGNEISILYMLVGRGTKVMTELSPGDFFEALGPLGSGFSFPKHDDAIYLLAGGTGLGSIYLFYRRLCELGFHNINFTAGFRSQDFVFDELVEEKVNIFTEDGSFGKRGLITEVLSSFVATQGQRALYACGPHGMLQAIAKKITGIDCFSQLSLEETMACGVGACLGCVAETENGRKTICNYGPVFMLEDIKSFA